MAAVQVALALAAVVARTSAQHAFNPERDSDSARIFGGSVAGAAEFPSQVYVASTIFDEGLDIRYRMFCGGTIISRKWIVTAAHCVNNSLNTLVGYGSAIRTEMKFTAGRRVIAHEKYSLYGRNNNNALNDIGLIELSQPLVLNGVTVAAAPLPVFLQPIPSNKGTVVIGWGRWSYNQALPSTHITSMLQKLNVEVIRCPEGNIDVICVHSKAGKGICDGDSGGPLMVDGIAFGVASYVDNIDPDPLIDPNDLCNDAGTWAVYTSMSAFREWIKDISGV